MLYKKRTSDGKYLIFVHELGVRGGYELILRGSGRNSTLEVFDDLEQTNAAVEHFLQCYSLAVSQDYYLVKDGFEHLSGCNVSFAEAFAIDKSGKFLNVKEFQKELLQAQVENKQSPKPLGGYPRPQ